MSNMENWKTLLYDGVYHHSYIISDQGRVINTSTGKIRRMSLNSDGYKRFKINRKQLFLHRAVAKSFCERRDESHCVNHINGNVNDCRAVNLEWCTQSYNVLHAISIGLRVYKKR